MNMESVAIGIHAPLLVHHVTVNVLTAYGNFNNPFNDTALVTLTRYGFRYLTMWNMALQTLYLLSCVVCYAMRRIHYDNSKTHAEKFDIVLKFVNISVVSPVAIFIILLFWTMFAINREYIYPRAMDKLMHPWQNYSMHGVIILLPFVEVFLQRSIRMPILKHCLLALTLFHAVYTAVLYGTFFINGVWLYPFLAVIPWSGKIVLIFVFYVLIVSFLTLTTTVHKAVFSRNKFRD